MDGAARLTRCVDPAGGSPRPSGLHRAKQQQRLAPSDDGGGPADLPVVDFRTRRTQDGRALAMGTGPGVFVPVQGLLIGRGPAARIGEAVDDLLGSRREAVGIDERQEDDSAVPSLLLVLNEKRVGSKPGKTIPSCGGGAPRSSAAHRPCGRRRSPPCRAATTATVLSSAPRKPFADPERRVGPAAERGGRPLRVRPSASRPSTATTDAPRRRAPRGVPKRPRISANRPPSIQELTSQRWNEMPAQLELGR